MGKLKLKRVIGKIIILSMSVCLLNGITFNDFMVFADSGVTIDEINFPDENFRNYVKENFDIDGDGVLSDDEIRKVWSIDCNNMGIWDLQGIEFFVNLEYLFCYRNNLTSLDVSNNVNLFRLDCRSNNLIELNIGYNEKLENLSCNYNQLTNIDLNGVTNLYKLDCSSNQLKSLDLSKIINLENLFCSWNQLDVLDVSNNEKLSYLECIGNKLIDLNLNENIVDLECYNNRLSYLNLNNHKKLKRCYCWNNCFSSVNAGFYESLFDNEEEFNYFTGYNIYYDDDDFLRLWDGTIYYDSEAKTLNFSEWNKGIKIDKKNFYDDNFRKYLRQNFDTDNDGYLGINEIISITEINCANLEIESLKGIEYFEYLKELYCEKNNLTDIDVSKNNKLTIINCSYNNIKKLDLSNNELLEVIDCNNNLLNLLDIAQCNKLVNLSCSNNKIKNLDLSNGTNIIFLSCYNNEMKIIDLSNLNVLNELYCWDNVFDYLVIRSNINCIPNISEEDIYNDFLIWLGNIEYNYSSDGQNTKTVTYSKHKKYIIPNVYYKVQIQKNGWEKSYLSNGKLSGTVGEAKRLEAIKIKLLDSDGNNVDTSYGSVLYKTHVQKQGWEKDFVRNDGISGTVGKGLRLEAIQIKLEGEITEDYDIYYQVQAEKFGWLGWAKNGESAGTAGYGYRLEAIKIKLVSKESDEYKDLESSKKPFYDKSLVTKIAYKTQVQTYGWEKKYAQDGAVSGTVGKAKRLEAIKIKIVNNPENLIGLVRYRTHVQKVGWQQYVQNDILSGTVGKGLRLEAIEINLTGDLAEKYDVYYRVQAQKFGWLGWAKNGESAGTSGYGYRLEAIQIQLAYKDTFAPGSTKNAYRKK